MFFKELDIISVTCTQARILGTGYTFKFFKCDPANFVTLPILQISIMIINNYYKHYYYINI